MAILTIAAALITANVAVRVWYRQQYNNCIAQLKVLELRLERRQEMCRARDCFDAVDAWGETEYSRLYAICEHCRERFASAINP